MHTRFQLTRMVARPAAIALFLFLLSPALAAEPAYLDDRSTAASLVESYYNAINRHEYARAYTYFGAHPPKPYDQFARGYADTVSVRVLTGKAISDGAAGSIYFTLPVAIDALETDGRHRQFAGCYVTRLIEPSIQEPPVTPMYVYSATLHPVSGALEDILPDCPVR